MSRVDETDRRKTVPWLQVATLFVTVTVARFALDLWLKG